MVKVFKSHQSWVAMEPKKINEKFLNYRCFLGEKLGSLLHGIWNEVQIMKSSKKHEIDIHSGWEKESKNPFNFQAELLSTNKTSDSILKSTGTEKKVADSKVLKRKSGDEAVEVKSFSWIKNWKILSIANVKCIDLSFKNTNCWLYREIPWIQIPSL